MPDIATTRMAGFGHRNRLLRVANRLSNDGRLAATNVHCQASALRSAINLDVHLDGVDNGVLSLPRGCLGRVHHGLHLLKIHIFQNNTHLILAGVFENLMAGAKALEQRLPLISTGKPRSHIADCVLHNHRCHTRSPEVWLGAQIRSRAPVFEPNTTCGRWIPAKFTAHCRSDQMALTLPIGFTTTSLPQSLPLPALARLGGGD